MIKIIFDFNYFSQSFVKLSIYGVFWNPREKQIPLLSLDS